MGRLTKPVMLLPPCYCPAATAALLLLPPWQARDGTLTTSWCAGNCKEPRAIEDAKTGTGISNHQAEGVVFYAVGTAAAVLLLLVPAAAGSVRDPYKLLNTILHD